MPQCIEQARSGLEALERHAFETDLRIGIALGVALARSA